MNKSAFTLIELLVVIAIIGILSVVVATSLEGARTKAQAAAIVQQFQQIEKAIQVEMANYGEYITMEEWTGTSGGKSIDYLVGNGYISSLPVGGNYRVKGSNISYYADTGPYNIDNCS